MEKRTTTQSGTVVKLRETHLGDKEVFYRLLNVLEFSSERKCMSVVVQKLDSDPWALYFFFRRCGDSTFVLMRSLSLRESFIIPFGRVVKKCFNPFDATQQGGAKRQSRQT